MEEWRRPRRPRPARTGPKRNAFWQRHSAEETAAWLKVLREDPHFAELAEAAAQTWEDWTPDMKGVLLIDLAVRAVKVAPELGHAYPGLYLARAIGVMIQARSTALLYEPDGVTQAEALEDLQRWKPLPARFLPDNPAVIAPKAGAGGEPSFTVPNIADVDDERHLRQIRDFKRSWESKRRGPAKGSAKQPDSGRAPIALSEARQIRAMRQAGVSLKEIALHFWPQETPDSAKMRKRIARRIEAADLADRRGNTAV